MKRWKRILKNNQRTCIECLKKLNENLWDVLELRGYNENSSKKWTRFGEHHNSTFREEIVEFVIFRQENTRKLSEIHIRWEKWCWRKLKIMNIKIETMIHWQDAVPEGKNKLKEEQAFKDQTKLKKIWMEIKWGL